MRNPTILHWFTILVLLSMVSTPFATAQQSETDLLQAIVCEIRELRSVVQQGQILVPLLEANRREREYGSQQLVGVEGQLHKTRENIERWQTNQRNARDGLRALARTSRLELDGDDAATKRGYEEVLRVAELEIPSSQGEEARLSSEAGQIRDRLSRLEDEFDRMQKQMQAMANSASSVCEGDNRR